MEISDYMRFVFALGFVLGLFGLLAYFAKRYGLGHRPYHKSQKRRLSISEVMPIDGKRRLMLVRRDNQEHLVIIGGETDLVIETNIMPRDSLQNVPSFQQRLDHNELPVQEEKQ